MLLLCTATLTIYDSEVAYNLFVESETGKYFFKPTTYENRNIYPPSFWMEQKGAAWEFEGISDKSLKDQAIEELSYCLNFSSGNPINTNPRDEKVPL
jgi:hypothetical protein